MTVEYANDLDTLKHYSGFPVTYPKPAAIIVINIIAIIAIMLINCVFQGG